MGLGKQAKVLSEAQQRAVLSYLQTTRYPLRNRVMFLLSVKAGLRAKEVAGLTWSMVCDPQGGLGDAIQLEDKASKGRSGRSIPLNRELRIALQELQDQDQPKPQDHIIRMERDRAPSAQVITNTFWTWYRRLGFEGCSSHSGRRTFITNAARKISTVGGSLRDVQSLAGHSSLQTTQRYIEAHTDARKMVVNLV